MFTADAYPPVLSRDEICRWLYERDPGLLRELERKANAVRERFLGHKRLAVALLDLSNHCAHHCACCSLRADNGALARFRLTADQVYDAAERALALGCGTLILQAGEDAGLTRQTIGEIVWRLRQRVPMRVFLSFGDRPVPDLISWHAVGADGYVLGLGRTTQHLPARVRAPYEPAPWMRVAEIRTLAALGYATGSVVIVGLPGQTVDSLADQILQLRALDVGLISVVAYEPAAAASTAAVWPRWSSQVPRAGQVGRDPETIERVTALVRLLRPAADVASADVDTGDHARGRASQLAPGANAIMLDLTPRGNVDAGKSGLRTNACGLCVGGRCHPLVSVQIEELGRLTSASGGVLSRAV